MTWVETKTRMTGKEKKRLLHKITIDEKEDKYGFQYKYFTAPDHLRPTPEDVGKRVWIASEPRTAKWILNGITEDGIQVQQVGSRVQRTLYHEEVLLHPSSW